MIYYTLCSHFSFPSLSSQLKTQKLLQKTPVFAIATTRNRKKIHKSEDRTTTVFAFVYLKDYSN